ncbi:hypothetical protein FKG94_11245 [Exilibacterium tricleocarpae]|uniref:Cadherin domain-containing protein n=1 Tax=Exilibacterium tricleocarpae TaxID=2591008 RepID=A0A545TQF1_9GAMM|nr:cadherin domain-containing protein [Exilibacterium tricleocarpae]TQV79437.1 hypothetical protein FKG94_11245 [Exilibacterium tricleocarpae]
MNYYLETSAGEASVRYELSSSKTLVVQARAGEQYRVVSSHGERPDNVVAVRTDADLEVRLDNGVNLIIDDYYVVCRNNFCGISLSEEGKPLSANEEANTPFSGDNTIVYSHGSLEGIVLLDLLGAGFVHEPQDQPTPLALSTVDDTIDGIPQGEAGGISALGMMSLAGAGLGLIAASASSGGDSPASPTEPRNKEAPVFTSGSGEAMVEISVDEGEVAVYRAEATDADSDILTYSLSGTDAALFNLDANTGELTFKEAPDYESLGINHTYDISITARDRDGLSANQDVIISVSDVNEAPAFTSDTTAAVNENQTAAYTAVATDPDGGALTYTLGGADAGLFNLDANTGELTFKDAPDYESLGINHTYDISITARDNDGLSANQDVIISVSNVNEAPAFTSDTTAAVNENQTAAYTAVATDPDGGALTYTLGGADAGLFNLDANTGELTFINAPDFENLGSNHPYNISITATDNDGLSASQDITISVNDVNEGPVPVFTSGTTATVNENQTAAYTAEVADPDGAMLTYSLSGTDASLFNIDENTGVVSFKNVPDYENPDDANGNNVYEIAVTATDSNDLSTSQGVTISVNDTNEAIALSELQLDNNDLGFVIRDEGSRKFRILNLSNAGDFNGDGLDDLIIGTPLASNNGKQTNGAAHVIFGKADGGIVDLSVSGIENNDNNSLGIDIDGFLHNNQAGGASVSNAGDVNGDGIDDILIGSSTATQGVPGVGYVIYGGSGLSDIDVSKIEDGSRKDLGFVVKGTTSDEFAARHIRGGGDVNGDGFDDLYISTSHNTNSYVVFGGRDLPNIDISEIVSGNNGIVVRGPNDNNRSGNIVGDINGDGLDDMAFSEARAFQGKLIRDIHVVYGHKNLSDIDLSEIPHRTTENKQGFAINHLRSARFDAAGDVNGDGFDDLIISEERANTPNGYQSGVSYVVFGGRNLSNMDLDHIERGIGGFAIYGAGENDRSGRQVRSIGDINGDGLGDLILANSEHGSSKPAKSIDHYVIYGKTDTDTVELTDIAQGVGGFVINAPNFGGGHGMDVSHAGDVNGDGFDDLVIGSTPLDPGDANPTPIPGITYVIYGGQNVSANALVGTSADEILEGSSHDDQIIAGQGNDTLIGNGGADVLRGGAGDDILAIRDTAFASLDGGNGIDTLRFDTALKLNFAGLSNNQITGVEKIDLRADGGNSHLILNLANVFNLGDNSRDTLSIHGSSGDSVELRNYGFAQRSGDWSKESHETWVFMSGNEVLATLLIDDSITVSAL